MEQIETFCFCSDNKRTNSKCFGFVSIISFDIKMFVLCFRFDLVWWWMKRKCQNVNCKICTGEALLREETHSVRWKLHPNLKVNQCARTLLYLTPCTYIKAAISMLIYLPFHSKQKERKNIYLSSSGYNIIIYYYL